MEPAGGGAVSAVQLARLAGHCDFFTAVGDDEIGRRAVADLTELGLRVHAVVRDRPTRRAFVYLDDQGERTITTIGERIAPHIEDTLPWWSLANADAVMFIAGDPGALRAARLARVLVATPRVLPVLREGGVELDALVGSGHDPGEAYAPGDIDPEPRLVIRTEGGAGGTVTPPGARFPAGELPGPVADAYGCGDAFVAGVAGGLRRYHEKHGVSVGDLHLTMPISLRTDSDNMGGNRITLMRFDVPVGEADPAHRIEAIHARVKAVRDERSLPYTQLIAGALNMVPRWYIGSVLRHVDFLASDVPGVPVPVYLGGAAVRAQYAFGPTIGSAVNVTLLSYVDTCFLGIDVDAAAIPDYEVFHDSLVAGFDEVLALAD